MSINNKKEVLHHINLYYCIVIICRFCECSIMAPILTIDKRRKKKKRKRKGKGKI
jgi:hypothetical protein